MADTMGPLTVFLSQDPRSVLLTPRVKEYELRRDTRRPPTTYANDCVALFCEVGDVMPRRIDKRDLEVGKLIKTLRLIKGMSQTDLATKLDLRFSKSRN